MPDDQTITEAISLAERLLDEVTRTEPTWQAIEHRTTKSRRPQAHPGADQTGFEPRASATPRYLYRRSSIQSPLCNVNSMT